MDDTQKLQKEIEELTRKVEELTSRLNSHTHTGADLTEQINLKDIYLGDGNEFFFQLPDATYLPTVSVQTGALAVVFGKLKIYTGSSWVSVGTQT